MTSTSLNRAKNHTKTRDRIRNAVLSPGVPLQIVAWRSQEPLKFAHRFEGEEQTLKVGDQWGRELFDCAWFQFTAEIPADQIVPLVARIDVNGELLIVNHEGTPVRGLTSVRSEFARCHGEPGKDLFRLPPEMVASGHVEIWCDGAFNDLFGGIQGEGRIEHAEVCAVRDDLRALYFDFEVLCDILDELADDHELCGKISVLLEEASTHLSDGLGQAGAAAARTVLAPLFVPSDERDALRVWAVGHAHLDLAWLWPIRETFRKGARTFATALANAESYPEHILGMSQPQLYFWMKEHYPELYQRIKKGVANGSIELQGRFWVEPDCNIPNGESLVRQVLHGKRFFEEEFGFVPAECWQPDVFGYNGQLPQILAKSGCEVFVTQKLSWNLVTRFPHHSFHWEGIDGTSILTHMLPEETYNGPAAPRSLKKIRDEYAQRDVSGHALMCYGIGDGGGGPGEEHLERLRRLRAFESLPAVEIRPTSEFFREWKKDAPKFPRWKGELYLERHQGTFTTQALVKKNNRKCEIALRELEMISVLAETLAGQAYPSLELDEIWKEVLLYQFHDILPGSSIKRVYDECNPRYRTLLDRIEALTSQTYGKLLGAAPGESATMAVNTTSWPREDWVENCGDWFHVHTPALGCARLPDVPTNPEGLLEATSNRLENEELRAEFSKDGTLCSLFDKRSGQESLSGAGNRLLVYPDKGDAWDYAADIPARNVWLYMRETPQQPRLVSSTHSVEGPNAVIRQRYEIGDSIIEQKIVLQAGSRLLVFDTELEWNDRAHMLRVLFPTDIKAKTARFEIPFGSIQRSAEEDTLAAKAQFEVCAQQWIDLADSGRGLALYNDCKYGFRVKNGALEMTLLRSVPHPSAAVISPEDTGNGTQEALRQFTDLGAHSFRYAIQPHDGALPEAELTANARAFNEPLRMVSVLASESALWSVLSNGFIEIDHPAIELVACKRAENGRDTVLRLCNVSPRSCSVEATIQLPFREMWETNLIEDRIGQCEVRDRGTVPLKFGPFEIRTLALRSA